MKTDEEKWFRRLERCIRDMPPGICVLVHHANIEMVYEADLKEHFDEVGDVQNVPEIDSFPVGRFYPCSESM